RPVAAARSAAGGIARPALLEQVATRTLALLLQGICSHSSSPLLGRRQAERAACSNGALPGRLRQIDLQVLPSSTVKGYEPGAAPGAVRSPAISSVRPPVMGAGGALPPR